MTTARFQLGDPVMAILTQHGLDAGGVYRVQERHERLTDAGPALSVSVQVGQRLVQISDLSVLRPCVIDAWGIRGPERRVWRRRFADEAALRAWCDENEALVRGQRFIEAPT